MRKNLLAIGLLAGAMAGCSQDSAPENAQAGRLDEPSAALSPSYATTSLHRSSVASLPDRGELLAYERNATPVKRGATTWHPVNLSEDHALRAVGTGTLTVHTPDGRPLRIKYQRHVEHRNGNWSWVGRMDGAAPGREAVLTFGEKAVFGSIPQDGGEPLKLTMSGGRAWLVQTDPLLAAANPGAASTEPDFLIPGGSGAVSGGALMAAAGKALAPRMSAAPRAEYSHTSSHATVDIALGYTAGLAASLGGQSQAITRLTHLVDLTNQAYDASGVDGELRLVRTVMVDYPDATSNRTTLFELTGVSCTSGSGANLPDGSLNCSSVGRPAALEPLVQARETYGADVVALVRRFENPESASCGIGWMLGGGQREITSADAAYAMSVISDTSSEGTCRDDTLAHEVGHNLGLQHDRETAQGTDDTNNDGNLLDPEEYGRYPYAFGHSTGAEAGNFYTVMSVRRSGQVGYLVFSNPTLTSCGGLPCGVLEQADNARALNQTMSVVAGFRATAVAQGIVPHDFNGDGASDVLWRNTADGRNVIWRSADSTTPQAVSRVASQAWRVVGAGDFNGDGISDLFWRNSQDGRNTIWLSGNSATNQAVSAVASQAWQVAGAGDFNGDGISDVLWRNSSDGRNAIWLSANSATPQAVSQVAGNSWRISGIGDFNGDGMSDLFWRNRTDGRNTVWLSASSATSQGVSTVGAQSWQVAAAGDFNGDGASDLLWRNSSDGRNAIWLSANSATPQSISAVGSTDWQVVTAGDYDGDGTSDLLWRNGKDGRNALWLSGNSATQKAMAAVGGTAWTIVK
jgi:hypothetical protein